MATPTLAALGSPGAGGACGAGGASAPRSASARTSRRSDSVPSGRATSATCARDALQDYVQQLENQLAVKTGLLDEALRVHRVIHGRLVTLTEGLSWKDQQLEQLMRREQSALRQAEQSTADSRQWRQRAESLEEENTALRDELRESSENNLRLRQFLEVLKVQDVKGYGLRSRTFSQQFPTEEAKENRKVAEEPPASVRAAMPLSLVRIPPGESAAKLSFFLTPQEAWAQVGSSAADRLCGVNVERLKVDDNDKARRLDRVDESKESKEDTRPPSISVKEVLELGANPSAPTSRPCSAKSGEAKQPRNVSPPTAAPSAATSTSAPHPRPVRYMSATQLSALAGVPAVGGAVGAGPATMAAGDPRVSPPRQQRWPPSPPAVGPPAATGAAPAKRAAAKPKPKPLLPLQSSRAR